MIKKIIFLIFVSITIFASQTKVLEVLKLGQESFDILGEDENSSYLLLEDNSLWLLEIPYEDATLLFKKEDFIEIGKTINQHSFETDEGEILYAKELKTKNFEKPFFAFEIGFMEEQLKNFELENLKANFDLLDFIFDDDDDDDEYDENPDGSILIVDKNIIILDEITWKKSDKIFKAYVKSNDGDLMILINLSKKEIFTEALHVAILEENIKTTKIKNISNISYENTDFADMKLGFQEILLDDDSKWTTVDTKNKALTENLKFKKIVFTFSPFLIALLDELFDSSEIDLDIKNKKFIILQDIDTTYPLIFGWAKK